MVLRCENVARQPSTLLKAVASGPCHVAGVVQRLRWRLRRATAGRFGVGHSPLQGGVEDMGFANEAKRELESAQGRNGYRPRNKWLALPAAGRHIMGMNSTVLEPNKLRPEIIQRVEAMDDESLLVLHRVLLIVEKQRLWRELAAEAEQDRRLGRFERLPEIIREARAELRQG